MTDDPDVNARVARIIRRLRERQQLTQGALARAVGFTQSAYSRLESGRQSITVAQLYAIAQTLRVFPDLILRMESEQR